MTTVYETELLTILTSLHANANDRNWIDDLVILFDQAADRYFTISADILDCRRRRRLLSDTSRRAAADYVLDRVCHSVSVSVCA